MNTVCPSGLTIFHRARSPTCLSNRDRAHLTGADEARGKVVIVGLENRESIGLFLYTVRSYPQ